jgi:pyridoxal phosphate enzyme (YggS family)
MSDIAKRLKNIRHRIDSVTKQAGKSPDQITLVGVSKKQPDKRIEAALNAGLRIFGENRVQEAEDRWAQRQREYPDLRLHLVGPLQSNKTARAVALFDVIETVDRKKIARYLAREMAEQERFLPCLIQVNIGLEDQKSGVHPDQLNELYHYSVEQGLEVTGLMCIPPFREDPVPYFNQLAKMADQLGLDDVSMGMSNDYEQAIQSGATIIRVGSGLFGPRPG